MQANPGKYTTYITRDYNPESFIPNSPRNMVLAILLGMVLLITAGAGGYFYLNPVSNTGRSVVDYADRLAPEVNRDINIDIAPQATPPAVLSSPQEWVEQPVPSTRKLMIDPVTPVAEKRVIDTEPVEVTLPDAPQQF